MISRYRRKRGAVIPAAYIKSGHLLPLIADGAEGEFLHIFLTVLSALAVPALKIKKSSSLEPSVQVIPPVSDYSDATGMGLTDFKASSSPG